MGAHPAHDVGLPHGTGLARDTFWAGFDALVHELAPQNRALLASRLAAKILPRTSSELGATAALLADIGLLLPCNVIVRAKPDGQLVVGFMDPVAVMQMTCNPEVARVAHEVRQRLERVRSALTPAASPVHP